jgi:hypothetical protein
MTLIFVLLIIFQVKHFLADYVFQNKYHLGKFSPDRRVWIPALASHASVHAAFTTVIALIVMPPCFLVFCVIWLDFTSHFIIDRIKASPKLLGRWKPDNKYYWFALGQDQMAHHLVHYFIIWLLWNASILQ